MRKAIRQCPGILQHVSESLLHDESFFTELLCLKPRLLEHVPASTQRLFPGLIASTFSDCFMAGMPHAILAAKIAPDVMHQREVLSAWFQAGGKFIFSVFLRNGEVTKKSWGGSLSIVTNIWITVMPKAMRMRMRPFIDR